MRPPVQSSFSPKWQLGLHQGRCLSAMSGASRIPNSSLPSRWHKAATRHTGSATNGMQSRSWGIGRECKSSRPPNPRSTHPRVGRGLFLIDGTDAFDQYLRRAVRPSVRHTPFLKQIFFGSTNDRHLNVAQY